MYRLNEKINADLEELAQLRLLSTSISSSNLSGMPMSSSRSTDSTFSRAIIKVIDIEKKIDSEVDRYVNLKEEVRERISELKNENERLVLQYRYLCYNTWEQIAEKMDFTVQWVHKLHKRALHNFSSKYMLELHFC